MAGDKLFNELVTKADSERDNKNWERAAFYYREACSLEPKSAPLLVQMGHALKESGNFEDAKKAYLSAQKLQPLDSDIFLQLGHLMKVRGDDLGAIKYYVEAIRLNAGNKDAAFERRFLLSKQKLLIRDLISRGSLHNAREVLKKLKVVDGVFEEECFTLLGDVSSGLGDLTTAEEAYKNALQLEVNCERAYIGLSRISLERRDFLGAVNILKLAMERLANAPAVEEKLEELLRLPRYSFDKNTVIGHFTGFNIDELVKIKFSEMIELIRQRQSSGSTVIVHPPFISWNIDLFQRPQHLARAFSRLGAVSVFFSNGISDVKDAIVWDKNNFFHVTLDSKYFDLFLELVSGVYVISYSTNPQSFFDRVLKSENHNIFEYVDHIDEKISSGWTEGCLANWNELSDQYISGVVVTASALEHDVSKRFGPERISLIQNGVDTEHFEKVFSVDLLSAEFRKIVARDRKIVGYYGAIAPWLDYNIILQLACAMPEIDFVYIGPLYLTRQETLPQRDNIHWIGVVNYSVLPAYASRFDCCFIPFEDGDIAESTSPLKLYEYFALGKPVVVTSGLKECVAFPIVRSGKTVSELVACIRNSLQSSDGEFSSQSKEIAAQNDWLQRAQRYLEFIRSVGCSSRHGGESPLIDASAIRVGNMLHDDIIGFEVQRSKLVIYPKKMRFYPGAECSFSLRFDRAAANRSIVLGLEFSGYGVMGEVTISGGNSCFSVPLSAIRSRKSLALKPSEEKEIVVTVCFSHSDSDEMTAESWCLTFYQPCFREDDIEYCNALVSPVNPPVILPFLLG